MSDALILFCTVFGTIIAYLTFKVSTTDVLKESKKLLIEKVNSLRQINSELLKDIYEYGELNNSLDLIFMQGLTLRQCINILERVQNDILAEENYFAIKNAKSKMRIDDITKNIEIQIKHHSEIRTVFDYFIKSSTKLQ